MGQIAVRRELAMLDVQAGQSARASQECDSIALAFGNDPLTPRPELEWGYAYAAEHSYWQGQLDQAMRYSEAGMEIASIFHNDEMLNALTHLQQLCACRRQQPGVVGEPSALGGEVSAWYGFVDWQIRWLLAIDRVDEAWEVARQYQVGQAADLASVPYFRAIPYLRAYVARGVELEAARPLLTDAFEHSVLSNGLPRQLELLALRAWLELQTGGEDAAREALSWAEELVAKTGYVLVLLDIPALAARWQHEDETLSPVERLHQLSKRERAVLILLGERLTYGRIGKELVISINTVRSHVRHIYKKLGVSTRDQAIQRAQEIGLLR